MKWSPSPTVEDQLLRAFLAGSSLLDLAGAHSLTLRQLLDWFESDQIRQLLHRLIRIQRTQCRIVHAGCSLPAIASLANLSTTAPNPNHRRLSASQVLRFASTLQRSRKPAPVRKLQPSHAKSDAKPSEIIPNSPVPSHSIPSRTKPGHEPSSAAGRLKTSSSPAASLLRHAGLAPDPVSARFGSSHTNPFPTHLTPDPIPI